MSLVLPTLRRIGSELTPGRLGVLGGGALGAAGSDPEHRLRGALQGAAIGGLGGHVLGRIGRSALSEGSGALAEHIGLKTTGRRALSESGLERIIQELGLTPVRGARRIKGQLRALRDRGDEAGRVAEEALKKINKRYWEARRWGGRAGALGGTAGSIALGGTIGKHTVDDSNNENESRSKQSEYKVAAMNFYEEGIKLACVHLGLEKIAASPAHLLKQLLVNYQASPTARAEIQRMLLGGGVGALAGGAGGAAIGDEPSLTGILGGAALGGLGGAFGARGLGRAQEARIFRLAKQHPDVPFGQAGPIKTEASKQLFPRMPKELRRSRSATSAAPTEAAKGVTLPAEGVVGGQTNIPPHLVEQLRAAGSL
jgi:hypothetical protein